jgi:hypothetical protein|tara:strand:+ start:736 stop:984 length:249 start_codon:yes stop_codon:yes gene_type:complete
MSDQPEYELDDDTRILVVSLLEIAIMASNVQLDPKHQESIVNIATVVGARFGIDIDFTQIVTNVDDINDGDWPFSISVSGIE